MDVLLPTCETAVSTVPSWHREILSSHEEVIQSPQGWSPGALNLAQALAMKLHAPLIHAEITRLLIDLSVYPEDELRWSRFSKLLTPEQRAKLDARSKLSYLQLIDARVREAFRRKSRVIHLSLDTLPDLGGTCLIFEYDSRREQEVDWARGWIALIRAELPEIVIDERDAATRSLSGYLRTKYPEDLLSIRLIAAQASFLSGHPVAWTMLKNMLASTLKTHFA